MQMIRTSIRNPEQSGEPHDSVMVAVMPSAIMWVEDNPDAMGCLLHMVDGSVLCTESLHGDADEFTDRVDRALHDMQTP